MEAGKQDYKRLNQIIRNYMVEYRGKIQDSFKKHEGKINKKKPIATWIKEDRLFSGIGYEFVIILKTIGCKWARSKFGGCSMCGYYNDCISNVQQEDILSQIDFSFQKYEDKIKEISQKDEKISLKLFTSGSFLDNEEIFQNTRIKIYDKIKNFSNIKEIIIETRPEFVKEDKLIELKSIFIEKTIILGIGAESTNNFVRQVLINKGFTIEDIKKAIKIAHKHQIKVKMYLLLKPPFLTEKIAIEDATRSIKESIEIGADCISLNPVSVYANTVVDHLHYKKKYRSPWIYSIFKVFQNALKTEILKKTLVLCNPSAAGKKRGVHNCNSKECNSRWLELLQNFVISQDFDLLKYESLPYNSCKCWGEYNLFLDISKS